MTYRGNISNAIENISSDAERIESQLDDFISERKEMVDELIGSVRRHELNFEEIVRELVYISDSFCV